MKYRRKSVPCTLCKLQTKDLGGVCSSCRDLYHEGELFRELKAAAEEPREEYAVIGGSRLKGRREKGWDDAPLTDPLDKLVRLVSQLAQTPVVKEMRWTDPEHRIGTRFSVSHYPLNFIVHLTAAQARAAEELLSLFRRWHRTGYDEGFDTGRSLLLGLADGTVSPEQFDQGGKHG